MIWTGTRGVEHTRPFAASRPVLFAAGSTSPRKDVTLLMNQNWRDHAACQGIDPEIFYPAEDDDAEPAKIICAQCPVATACLEYALAGRERDGVWGGATERERRRLVRQRRRTA